MNEQLSAETPPTKRNWSILGGMGTRFRSTVWELRDILQVLLLLNIGLPLVPRGGWLGRPDLLRWTALSLSVFLATRAPKRTVTVHPDLPIRVSGMARLATVLCAVLVPWVLLGGMLLGRLNSIYEDPLLPTTILGGLLLAALAAVSGRGHSMAWAPRKHGRSASWTGFLWFWPGFIPILASVLFGMLQQGSRNTPTDPLRTAALDMSILILLANLWTGWLLTPALARHQRRETAQHKARSSKKTVLPWLEVLPHLASAGFVLVIFWIGPFNLEALKELGFEQAPMVSLVVGISVALAFTRRMPVAVSWLLHEVEPIGGRERITGEGGGRDFHQAPEGALVFNPFEIRRTGRLHPWCIPLSESRVVENLLDAPRPWTFPPPLRERCALGKIEVRYRSLAARTEISLQLEEVSRMVNLNDLFGLERLIRVRRVPASRTDLRRDKAANGNPESPQSPAQAIDLQEGDIILLSVGGVFRAYELELGPLLYGGDEILREPPANLEDVVASA